MLWDEDHVFEWREIAGRARHSDKKIHMGRLFGICVQKNSELPDDDPRKKYKYRVVFVCSKKKHLQQRPHRRKGLNVYTKVLVPKC